jgi:hypothetical protein
MLGLTLSALVGPAAAVPDRAEPAAAQVGHAGERQPAIRWHKSLAAAKASAARTGKPLFLLHLFGKLDEAFC